RHGAARAGGAAAAGAAAAAAALAGGAAAARLGVVAAAAADVRRYDAGGGRSNDNYEKNPTNFEMFHDSAPRKIFVAGALHTPIADGVKRAGFVLNAAPWPPILRFFRPAAGSSA